jgi:hypothetical protein
MTNDAPACLYCQRTSDEVPLLTVDFKGQKYAICPTHFPILIHQPDKLKDKLPGIENLQPGSH